MEVAAAGGHHLLLSGPKGAGKTSLAERIPGILPDLTREEALELTAVRSLAGPLGSVDERWELTTRPPFQAPAPRRVQGEHPGRWQRPGPARES